jgi:hypothetical protein
MRAIQIALCLLCAGPALAQHSQADYDVAAQKKQAAWSAYWACRNSGAWPVHPCATEYAAYREAEDAELGMINADLKANEPALLKAAAELNAVADRINAYVSCRRAKHWWQFWKRCRY